MTKVIISAGEEVSFVVLTKADGQEFTYFKVGNTTASILPPGFSFPQAGEFLIMDDGGIPVTPVFGITFTAIHGGEHEPNLEGGGAFDSDGNMWVALKD